MHYCMNKQQLNSFITFQAAGEPIELKDLLTWVDSSNNWQIELGFLNYLFIQILEKKKREGLDCHQYIDCLYQLEEKLYMRIHDLDYQFIDYMLLFLRQNTLSLEEELVQLHNNMCEFIYE